MWYRTIFADDSGDSPSDRGYEAKIIRSCAERVVRRLLALRGQHAPSAQTINRYVEQIVDTLKDRYRSLNNVRLHVDGERLTPAVEEVAREIIK